MIYWLPCSICFEKRKLCFLCHSLSFLFIIPGFRQLPLFKIASMRCNDAVCLLLLHTSAVMHGGFLPHSKISRHSVGIERTCIDAYSMTPPYHSKYPLYALLIASP